MSDDLEIWKDIKEYEGKYQVSTAGRVRRLYKHEPPRVLKPTWHKHSRSERLEIMLFDKNSVRKTHTVARLVAETFIGIPDGASIHHKNGLRRDNWIGNLEIVQHKDLGHIYGGRYNTKPVVKIDKNGDVVEVYANASRAAEANYFHPSSVAKRCNGKRNSLFAPDGYAYCWDDERELNQTINNIKKVNANGKD